MDLWHILVLAVVRHTLSNNRYRLEHLANDDQLIRVIMGVLLNVFTEDDKIKFTYQTILDNDQLIDEDLLQQINLLIVEAVHSLLKKRTAQKAKRQQYLLILSFKRRIIR